MCSTKLKSICTCTLLPFLYYILLVVPKFFFWGGGGGGGGGGGLGVHTIGGLHAVKPGGNEEDLLVLLT